MVPSVRWVSGAQGHREEELVFGRDIGENRNMKIFVEHNCLQ